MTSAEQSMKSIMEDDVKKKEPTKQKPFNLTKPKPKVIEEPIPIKREVKANPLPKNMYKKTLKEIEEEKKKRRQKKIDAVKKQYEQSEQFALATKTRPNHSEAAIKEFEDAEARKMKFNMKHTREMPDFEKKKGDIKFNAAAII